MAQEAKKLRTTLSRKRYLELGFEYAFLAEFLDKKITKKELVEALVRAERNYAKRQMRWFKRNQNIHWVKNKAQALTLARSFLY